MIGMNVRQIYSGKVGYTITWSVSIWSALSSERDACALLVAVSTEVKGWTCFCLVESSKVKNPYRCDWGNAHLHPGTASCDDAEGSGRAHLALLLAVDEEEVHVRRGVYTFLGLTKGENG